MKGQDGGPAFPTTIYFDDRPVGMSDGLSLRDYFAGQALIAYLHMMPAVWTDGHAVSLSQSAAQRVYQIADALIAERAK